MRPQSQTDIDATIDALRTAGVSILNMKRRDLTLEEAFLQIVKEHEI